MLPSWERGERQPTLKQLESYAQATHTPIGANMADAPASEIEWWCNQVAAEVLVPLSLIPSDAMREPPYDRGA